MLKWLSRIYDTYVFTPLAGGNGKIQMEEYARTALLVQTLYSAYLEGKGPEQLYPDIYWIMILTAICTIAGMKHIFKKDMMHTNNKPPQQGEQIHGI